MDWLEGDPANLSQVLASRDERQALIDSISSQSIISITIVMPGPVKLNRLSRLLLDKALQCMEGLHLVKKSLSISGPWAVLYSEEDPAKLKERFIELEDSLSYGRLLDIDVYCQGKPLSRREERACIVCSKPGKACARSREHSLEELRAAVLRISGELRNGC